MDNDRPVARVQMLVRRPVREVFTAFVDPAVTTQFWFTGKQWTSGSGRAAALGMGDVWRVGVGEGADGRTARRIVIEWVIRPDRWNGRSSLGPPTPRSSRSASKASAGGLDEQVAQALDSTGGFTVVLAGLKALLEHGVQLDLVRDQHPDALVQGDEYAGVT